MDGEKVLITGGAGFFGGILKGELLRRGFRVVSVDLEPDDTRHPNLQAVQGDIRDRALLRRLVRPGECLAVFHLAAILAHAVNDQGFLWSCNVEGTRSVAQLAVDCGIPQLIYLSSNCLWGEPLGRPVREDDPPRPVELYGSTKWEAEQILLEHRERFNAVILRCPTIIDAGRLGLLAILFEFIDEGRRVWVVDGGRNRYQFIYAGDLVDACLKALDWPQSDIFNIGSERVPSFAETYRYVIDEAGSRSRLANLPGALALPAMRLAHRLGLSPLGPYQYKMIAEDFQFDIDKIKRSLGWRPTLSNPEMLLEAYRYYREHRAEIEARVNVSAHRRPARMGIIRLLKWLS